MSVAISGERLANLRENPEPAQAWLESLGLEDPRRGAQNLASIAESGMTPDLLAVVAKQIAEQLPRSSDPDMALNNLERYVDASRSPLSLGTLFERDAEALPILLQIFATSQHLSDVLIGDPESFDLLRMTDGRPYSRSALVQEILNDVRSLPDERSAAETLRRFKRRETLRIAYGDIVRGQPIETVTKQISYLADALCEAAIYVARRRLEERRGEPLGPDGKPARLVALGMGKLGGMELNYSSDIDLVFLYDHDGKTTGPKTTDNLEFFDRLVRQVVKLLAEPTEWGSCYRFDLRLRPEGGQGAAVISVESARRYYDLKGRTWERQAFVKARAVAGDQELGQQFLGELQPWIYRRYLSRADITGIKALKRRIEHRTVQEGEDDRNVKTGRGGIRDIEFVIQFLQLLNGGDLVEIRTGNTLQAVACLEGAGCLTPQERSILERNYAFLRKLEHRLQIMFDLQTHTIPEGDQEQRKLAIRMGYADDDEGPALAKFREAYRTATHENRKILDHLLHDAFGDESQVEPEVDLILHPDPSRESIRRVLGKYGFRDAEAAYRNLMALANERIQFLSTRRCRHFLAAIAPDLLAAISATPEPDATLVNLSQVSDSLGGKGVLWELFSVNQPTMQLYVRLCAASPYLSGILTSNPGMIDELLDSLLLDRLPTRESLESELNDLVRRATDIDPILHSFKNSQHLRVGVRDILGKEDIEATTAALADVAHVCLAKIAEVETQRLVEKFGQPTIGSGPRAGEPCEMVIVGMGKLGGREPNYHSDLDIVFVYEDEGTTQPARQGHRNGGGTTNQHFFGQLGQRIIKTLSHLGPYGRLYEADARLRPTGKSGMLAVSIAGLEKYFSSGAGQLWERQALCKARSLTGAPRARQAVDDAIAGIVRGTDWSSDFAREIRDMRYRIQQTASPRNIKRGPGGTVDVEFAVQMLQLKHAAGSPSVLAAGTWQGLRALHAAGALSDADSEYFVESYRFLRGIEARLRLMNTTARHEVPSDPLELRRLAYLLGYEANAEIWSQCREYMQGNRQRFERIFAATASA